MSYRRGRGNFYGYTNLTTPEIHLMPYIDIDNFPNDSSDMDLGLTMIKLDIDNNNININCFNAQGIKLKSKKKLPKQQETTVIQQNYDLQNDDLPPTEEDMYQ